MTSSWLDDLVGDGRKPGLAAPREKRENSPYFGVEDGERIAVTRKLLLGHPLDGPTLVDAVLAAWDSIFESSLGGFNIGEDIFPLPQTMGFFLHELVPLRLAADRPDWRRDSLSGEKDLVYIPNSELSIEIKTSSHKNQIFGNRSFGLDNPGRGKKAKDGFYLTINFQSWKDAGKGRPEVNIIRYGWIDHTDWMAQTAQSGQNSTLPAEVYNSQLLTIFKR